MRDTIFFNKGVRLFEMFLNILQQNLSFVFLLNMVSFNLKKRVKLTTTTNFNGGFKFSINVNL